MTIPIHRCASCPADVVPVNIYVQHLNQIVDMNVLRGWQAGDGRWFCLLCVVSGGMYARRGQ